MRFEPLSHDTLRATIASAHAVFPADACSDNAPADAYRAYVYPKRHRDFYRSQGLATLVYWIATERGTIVGATGLYSFTNEPDVAWLGWYFVVPAQRGRGFGRKMLAWTMARARSEGFRTLRLYTSTDPNEAVAQKLYDHMGFAVIDREQDPDSDYMMLYRERRL